MAHLFLLTTAGLLLSSVNGQPAPSVQAGITAAIKNAANATTLDYTAFVNPFIGTGMACFLVQQEFYFAPQIILGMSVREPRFRSEW